MGLGSGQVILNQLDIKTNAGIKAGDRGMESRLKALAPGGRIGRSRGWEIGIQSKGYLENSDLRSRIETVQSKACSGQINQNW